MNLTLASGRPYPLGATVQRGGVNFSIYSRSADAVSLLLFEHHADAQPAALIRLDPQRNRTFDYWHVFVQGIGLGQLYGWQVAGPYAPESGQRFDGKKVLLDPYTRAVMYGDNYDRKAAKTPGANLASALKSVVVDPGAYDWEGDEPLKRPRERTLVYELHVRGFTRHPSSAVARPGTYAGLVEKLPYLQELGVTAIELLPIQQFDPQEVDSTNPLTGEPLRQYWGYQPIAFFAPHRGYCVNPDDPLAPLNEFRDLVKACHRAGLEVILDVVYNHTAEGGSAGPTLCFRGLENSAYYLLEEDDPSQYANHTGTGNTVNANHPIVRNLILDSLRYWVQQMHVDGFRFDLAAALTRGEDGQPLPDPPLLQAIEADPALAGTKIIAEPWDLGLYQVGSFPGQRWQEWNGKFRDDIRRFVRGDAGVARVVAERLLGSPDLYRRAGHAPHRSVNYVTCHDGFTLNDLVSYEHKHNLANGEENRDGNDHNHSWNHGVEGPSDDPAIAALRERQIKNLFTLLLLAQGTPLLLAGDEFRRTQLGNNNAYCQDNELSWLDWSLRSQHGPLQRFVRELIRFRSRHPGLNASQFLTPEQVIWHGVQREQPDWSDEARTIAVTLRAVPDAPPLHLIANAFDKPLLFELPQLPLVTWRRTIDTARPAPDDILIDRRAPATRAERCRVLEHSVVVFVAD